MSETNKIDKCNFTKTKTKFKKDKNGVVYAYRDGKRISPILNMESVLPDLVATHLVSDKDTKHKE